jgi:membrane fusion protein, multidrug efflux system
VRVRSTEGGAQAMGTVEFIDNAVDAATGTVLVKARLANEDEAFWPGQVVEAAVRLGEKADAVVVPASAVAQGQQGDYAFVVKDGAADLRLVTVTAAGEREVVIGKGILAGEVVVVEGQIKLVPGAKVEPLAREARP